MTIRICSNALDDGAPIPEKYSPDWLNFSPPLRFENIPADARELVLIVEDPDASTPDPWVHWLMYKIPGDVDHLPEGVVSAPHPEEPAGALQGRNTAGCVGYDGPAPPPGHGVHHYHFKV
jgi:Raf kinase inhibitor-like YbhB/YbcL family protein